MSTASLVCRILLSSFRDLQQLSKVHTLLIVNGSPSHQMGHLIAAYGRLGNIQSARNVFDGMPHRNIAIWNSIIVAYARNGCPGQVLALYRRLVLEGTEEPNSSTFTVALRACSELSALKAGEKIAAMAFSCGYGKDVFVCSSLLNLCIKSGKLDDALKLFDGMRKRDLVSWTTMIIGSVGSGRPCDAITMFRRMRLEGGLEGDGVVMVGLIQACACLGDLRRGLSVHGHMIRNNMKMDVICEISLVDLYGKVGSLNLACRMFERMPFRNVISWSALISGFAQHGFAAEAMQLLVQMQDSGLRPDTVTLVSVLLACLQIGFLKMGRAVHGFIVRWLGLDHISGTTVVDMYSKCGRLAIARAVFDRIRDRDLILWNAMISCYGIHGYGKEALLLFQEMSESSTRPNDATFAALLSALSHSGLVREGRYWFHLMSAEFKIKPNENHYVCIVDLLSHAGHIAEAYEFIENMGEKPGIAIWVALLSGCRNHKNIAVGERIARVVLELQPDDLGVYSLISNVFAAAKKWNEVAEVRRVMKKMGTKKVPGYSLVEVSGRLHAFLKDDKSHPQYEKIASVLKGLDFEIRKMGYVPKTDLILQDLDKATKEKMLSNHSERLALSFGLLSTGPRTRLLIIKNLRICEDCHEAIKLISKLVNREIIVRDAKRFHHFENGYCSCRDYW